MTTPRLSVGLPVYNGADFLAESIESVLAQDLADFELVISDNGSTDSTPDICAHYAARDRRVRYHREPVNRGGAWNYNRVFTLAAAPIFKWQAHDDVCLPGLFRRCVPELEQAPPAVALVFPETELVDAHRRPIRQGILPEPLETRDPRPHRRLAHVLRHMTMVRPQFGFIRAAALRQTRLYATMIAADFVLLAELALLGELWAVPEPLFQRRLHPHISTRASHSESALLQWWDPTLRPTRHLFPPLLRLGGEYLRSIRRLPLPLNEKLLCSAVALWVWHERELRNLAGRTRRRLTHRFRHAAPADPLVLSP